MGALIEFSGSVALGHCNIGQGQIDIGTLVVKGLKWTLCE